MKLSTIVHICVVAFAAACAAPAATAQNNEALTTAKDVREEISEAMEAVASYSKLKRDEALSKAREALDRLDDEIERREQQLREEWTKMPEKAREGARKHLWAMRKARNRLGERYGAMKSGTASAWDELRSGFSDAWHAFSKEWTTADTQTSPNL